MDPGEHHRRSIRLSGYDYTQAGAYFVTFCTHDRGYLFGQVADGRMQPNPYGLIVESCWLAIPFHFAQADVGPYVVMPNHFHGIVVIMDDAYQTRAGTADDGRGTADEGRGTADEGRGTADDGRGTADDGRGTADDGRGTACRAPTFGKPVHGSLGTIIRSFKAAVTRRVNQQRENAGGQVWQPNYYEHIIRDADEWDAICQYIAENPSKWDQDRENPGETRPQG